MATIYSKKPLSLLEQLLNPQSNGPSFGQQIGHNLHQQILQNQANQREQGSRQQEFQQQQSLLQEKERQRSAQGAAMARLLGGEGGQGANLQMREGEEAPKSQSFADKDFREIAREALASGFDQKQVMDLKKLHEDAQDKKQQALNRKEDIELKKESQKITKEAPARKELTKRLTEVKDLGKKSKQEEKQYETLNKLMKEGDVRSGTFGRAANYFGLGKIFSTPATQVAEKIIAQLNASNLTNVGLRSLGGLQEIAKGQLSTNMDPESFGYIAKIGAYNAKANNLFADEVDRLSNDYIEKGQDVPLNIENMAMRNIAPQLEDLEQKSFDAMENFDRSIHQHSGIVPKNAQKGNAGFKIPEGTMYGELLINPTNKQKRDIYVGNGNVIPEDQFKILEKDLPASQNQGRTIKNKKLGLTFVSDGQKWNAI